LSSGGVAGMGEKLFAIPWKALKLDTTNKRFTLNVDKEHLGSAPGFDKDDWPDMADPAWQNSVHSYYGLRSYTESGKIPETSDTPDTPYEETPYTKPQKG
jgi:hypothetical protein